ncbi:paralemmin-3 isoform X2 [Hyperolius riggenbachi]|uniref:paralemmin-3 isoform X2 n=1 Tax=Hyperolius riggenbachi TaxID=752182 RepID=UPI0035A3B5C8
MASTIRSLDVKMGETQLYSQRLHGINEKRRILSEVERIQRELDQQRIKLHQLKRKSLRDRWLMEGLLPSPGAETENPLGETENQIKTLEDELESLQLELVYLENPDLKNLKATKVQDTKVKKELVNGDGNLQRVDQNENLKEHTIREEADQPSDSQEERPAVTSAETHEKNSPPTTDGVTGRPTPAPRGRNKTENNVQQIQEHKVSKSDEEGENQTHPSQTVDNSDHKEEGVHKPLSLDNETQHLEHNQETKDQKAEHEDQKESLQNHSVGEEDAEEFLTVYKIDCREHPLEPEEDNMRDLTKDMGHVALEVDSQGQKAVASQPISGNEDLDHDEEESLLDEIRKLVHFGKPAESDQPIQNGNEPSLSTEEQRKESTFATSDQVNGQNPEDYNVSVSLNHEQHYSQEKDPVISLEKEATQLVELDNQEKIEIPVIVSIKLEATEDSNQGSLLQSEDHNQDSATLPIQTQQSSTLLPTDEEEFTVLPCTDKVPSPSLPPGDQNKVNQVQISEVVVVSAPGPDQPSANSQQDTSASDKPNATETSAPPESQPLLEKSQESDGHPGTNTAETRDKGTPVKKKSCSCCVVM